MLSSRRLVLVLSGVVSISILAAACGPQRPERSISGAADATTARSSTKSGIVEAYAVPNLQPQLDGSLAARVVQGTTVTRTSALGSGTDVWQLHPTSATTGVPSALLAFQSNADRSEMIQLPISTQADSRIALPGNAVQQVALQVGSSLFTQDGNTVIEGSVGSTSGSPTFNVTRTFTLPLIESDPVAGVTPPGYKGIYVPNGKATVSSLIETPNALVALASTGRGSAVINISTGHSKNLTGYGQLGAAALGVDGSIYVLAWRRYEPNFTIKLLQIDPGTFSIERSFDTKVAPGKLRNSVVLPSTSRNVIVGLFYGDEAGITADLWSAAAGSMTPMANIPLNAGLDVSLIDNTLYLFGGPARNTVSTLGLTSGVLLSDVAALRAPPGSYVVAVGPA